MPVRAYALGYDAGTQRTVGWFLMVLGVGLKIPRPGLGLYSLIHAGGDSDLWAIMIVGSSAALILSARFPWQIARLAIVGVAMLCWAGLGFKFVEGQLWGATLQAITAITLLNACAWRLYRQTRSEGNGRKEG